MAFLATIELFRPWMILVALPTFATFYMFEYFRTSFDKSRQTLTSWDQFEQVWTNFRHFEKFGQFYTIYFFFKGPSMIVLCNQDWLPAPSPMWLLSILSVIKNCHFWPPSLSPYILCDYVIHGCSLRPWFPLPFQV